MDEVDSIGSARSESGGGGGGGDSEVQRTMLELLNQLDGFEATNKIKARPPRRPPTLKQGVCGVECWVRREGQAVASGGMRSCNTYHMCCNLTCKQVAARVLVGLGRPLGAALIYIERSIPWARMR